MTWGAGGAQAKRDTIETISDAIPTETAGRDRLIAGLQKLSYQELRSLEDALWLLHKAAGLLDERPSQATGTAGGES